MARFTNKSNINFPFQECVVSKGQATSTADHLFLRPGENRLDKHPQNPWEAIHGCETGMPLMTSWPMTVITQRIRDPLITVHGILDPWCQQYNYYDHLISCILLWCLFNSHGPKTLWLLLTPSQGYRILHCLAVVLFCLIIMMMDSRTCMHDNIIIRMTSL
jgi:hypothetical protein